MRIAQWVLLAAVVVACEAALGAGGENGFVPVPARVELRNEAVAFLTREVPAASAPALNKLVTLPPMSVKTAGHTPEEAMRMLGQEVGVKLERRIENAAGRGTVDTKVDFDLEMASFWEGVLRLGESAKLMPQVKGDRMTLQALPRGWVSPARVTVVETPVMRTMLSIFPVNAGQERSSTRMNLEFLVDPRLLLLEVGQIAVEAADAPAGKRCEGNVYNTLWPGNNQGMQHGMQTVTNEVVVRRMKGEPAVMDVFEGYVPAVVATKWQSLELAIENGTVKDREAHRVGDWSVAVTDSWVRQGAMGGFRRQGNREAQWIPVGAAGTGPPPPDHSIKLVLERMKDTAPAFPTWPWAMVQFDGVPGVSQPIVVAATVDGKKQEWTVRWSASRENALTKVVLEVPLEVKAAVLPFAFRKVALE